MVFIVFLKKGLKTHCTHCTNVLIAWISVFPSAMSLFFTCHWCHSTKKKVTSVTWHFCLSLHGDLLIISWLYVLCNEWHEFFNLEKIEWNDSIVFRITINPLNFFQRKTWRLNIKTPSRFSNFSKFFFNNSKCFFNFSPDKLFVCLY